MNIPNRPQSNEPTEYASLDELFSLAERDADNRLVETDLETDQLDERALQLHQSGKTYRQIGLDLGISKSWAYVRVQRALMSERALFPGEDADVRDELMQTLRQGVGPVIANAAQGDLKAFRALNQYANTMVRLLKIQKPTARQRMERVKLLRTHWERFKIPSGHHAPSCTQAAEAEAPPATPEPPRGQDCGQTCGQEGGQQSQPEAALVVIDAEEKKAKCVDNAPAPVVAQQQTEPEKQPVSPQSPTEEAAHQPPVSPCDCGVILPAAEAEKMSWPISPAQTGEEAPQPQFIIPDPDEDFRRATQQRAEPESKPPET